MSRSSSYYYVILKMANPTAETLENGLRMDDILEAADAYNARFKRLKQLLILKSDGIKIHAILSLAALSGVSVKRVHSDFSTHIAFFSNYLLNQKQWSTLTQDYRRLLVFAGEPQTCSVEEVTAVLAAIGYLEEDVVFAAQHMPFVGPSERTPLKWLLHVKNCLDHPPHEELGAPEATQPQAVAQTTANEPSSDPASEPSKEPGKDSSGNSQRNANLLTPAATILRNHYQRTTRPTATAPVEKGTENEERKLIPFPAEAIVDEESATAEFLEDLQHLLTAETEQIVTEQLELGLAEQEVTLSETSPPNASTAIPVLPLNDEQLMAVLHSLVLTQNIGDEQAVARKKETIERIKLLIAPWANFG